MGKDLQTKVFTGEAALTSVPITHYFSDGIYCRHGIIPAHTFIVGHKHLHDHLNVLLKGKLAVAIDDEIRIFEAPHVFEALAGSVKGLMTFDECHLMNIHKNPSNTRDLDTIKEELVEDMDPHDHELFNRLRRLVCS